VAIDYGGPFKFKAIPSVAAWSKANPDLTPKSAEAGLPAKVSRRLAVVCCYARELARAMNVVPASLTVGSARLAWNMTSNVWLFVSLYRVCFSNSFVVNSGRNFRPLKKLT
jgi:hypothetical protein